MTSSSDRLDADSSKPRVRWWPLVLVAGGLGLVLLWTWTAHGEQRQDRVVLTIVSTGSAGILAFLWLLLFSRAPMWIRGATVALMIGIVALGAATLERRGVTGDVLPLLRWRWSGSAVEEGIPGPEIPLSRVPVTGREADYPQFLGPARDGVLGGIRLATDWQARPPRLLWRRAIGEGWSGFAVSGPFAVTQEQRGEQEMVTCYARESGELIWAHGYPARHDDPLGGPGPRATPTIHQARVYALGATGILSALELQSGGLIWSTDVLRDAGARAPTYGVAASPLVIDGLVVIAAGGEDGHSLVAYAADSGTVVWSGGDRGPGYSSPILAELAGRRQIALFNGSHFTGHDATHGTVLWEYAWLGGSEHVSQPVILPDDRLFLSSGYGVGGKLFRISEAEGRFEVGLVWESRSLKAKMTNVVHRDGYLYGLDDGRLACVELATGQRMWKAGRYGHGQVILVHDLLLIQAENGDVVLVRAIPDEHRALARLDALGRKTWNHPALAGRHLFLRNDRDAACFELPIE